MNITERIRNRRSVRSFDGNDLGDEIKREILDFANRVETPYEIPIHWQLLDAKAQGLSCPVITGTNSFLAGKMQPVPHAEEAFGYAFEQIALYAVDRGLGTTCIAGTMDRPAFERAMRLEKGEVMPCITPLGVPAAKMSLRETMMRKGVKADSRLPFEELFFDGGFDKPLSKDRAGGLAEALELVRLAPSAVNKQPWRLVVAPDTVYFYEKKSKGFTAANGWDIQKVDMGIALCHFALGLEAKGEKAVFTLEDPGLTHPGDTAFISDCRIDGVDA